jgi:lysophospholipase L1-like esterase
MACSEEITEDVIAEEPLSKGSADFTKYVAIGNSLTAGYTDRALFKKGQEDAYPNLLSQKFAEVGGGTFTTPWMNDNTGGMLINGTFNPNFAGRLILEGFTATGSPIIKSLSQAPYNQFPTSTNASLGGSYNNMGIPGAKVGHLLFPGYAMGNPYYGRFASGSMARVIDDALAQNPTFFSLWIGNNDVLGYATTGGDGTDPITSSTDFDNAYNSLVNSLTQGGRKGVIANIPAITSAPFFKAVSFNPITVASLGAGLLPNGTIAEQIAAGTAAMNQLNAQLLGPLDQILTALGQPNRFQLLNTSSNNPLLIVDEGLSPLGAEIQAIAAASGNPQLVALAPFLGSVYGQARHATKDDLVLLSTSSVIGQPAGSPVPSLNAFGVSFPLQDRHILVPTEIAMINTATASFNNTIKSAANAKGLAFVDVHSLMVQLSTTGIRFDNFHMNAGFITGGTFSLDGIHITPRGNAFIANKFLEAIELTYGSKFNKFKPQDKPLAYTFPIQD